MTFYILCSKIMPIQYVAKSVSWDERGVEMNYLICDKRKGNPKIHIEVCKRKCKLIAECKTYKEHLENLEKKAA